jgi:hypothetical protein
MYNNPPFLGVKNGLFCMGKFITYNLYCCYAVWTDRKSGRFWVKDNLSDGLEIYGYLELEGKVTNK